jgi:hypothetical protein
MTQGENFTKNLFRHYGKIPTKEDEKQASELLKKLCPSLYEFLNSKK